MPTSKSRPFTTRLKDTTREQVGQLLNEVAKRAYEMGYKDAKVGLPKRPHKVVVAEKNLWKLK